MVWAELMWGLLALVLLLDARRISRRLASIPVLRLDDADTDEGLAWVVAPGVHLDPQTKESARAYMHAHGLAAIDLLPGHLSLAMAWSMGCHIDPDAHTADRTRPGDTGLHAFAAPTAVLAGLGFGGEPPDLASFVSLAREVRRRVDGPHGLAIAPTLEAAKSNPFFDAGALGVKLGGSISPVAFGIPFATGLMVLGPFLAPWMGSVALLVHLLQQWIAVRSSGLVVRLGFIQGLFRIVVDLAQWLFLLRGRQVGAERIDALRPVYTELLAAGTGRFFEPKMEACPFCASTSLTRGFTLPDLYQGKPGRFTLVRCKDCQLRFQNPRLTVEGLNFYYRDFYDGIGEDALDLIFGATKKLYADRVDLIRAHCQPERWMDVGCGHGHLFAHVRAVLPDTELVGLDMGAGVETAKARGWVDEAHQGMFPELAPGLSEQFDVVSMCHYLEHTVDPKAELAAAALVLKPGGHLLIEVPDPQSIFAKVLGAWWMPWFQPQHLHFMTTVIMAAELRKVGLEPVEWHTGRANTANDFVLSFTNMVSAWAPDPNVPWRRRASVFRRIFNGLVWIPGGIFVASGALLDHALHPIAKRLHHSSQFRVIAKKLR
jgi:2-polyprenyl-3-methyl-5-hydroxy-6-metoxy-1,4-benzoquinol methylase